MGGGAAQAEQVLHQQGKQVRDGQGRFALILLIELSSGRCAYNLPCIGSCARIVATKKRWNRCARSSTPNPSAIVRAGESFNKRCDTKQLKVTWIRFIIQTRRTIENRGLEKILGENGLTHLSTTK